MAFSTTAKETSDEEMTDSQSMVRSGAEATALLLATLYVIGFVVVNVHLSHWHPPSLDLWEGRYVAAGFLYILLTTLPIGLLYYTRKAMGTGGVIRGVVRLILVPVVLPLLMFGMIALEPSVATMRGYATYVMFLLGGSFLVLQRKGTHSLEKVVPEGRTFFFGVLLLGVITLTTTVLFAEVVYPKISPSYGGGGAWVGVIHEQPVENAPAAVLMSNPVLMVSQDSRSVYVISCMDSDEGARSSGREVPRSRVAMVEFVRPYVAHAFVQEMSHHRTCQEWSDARFPPSGGR